MTARSHTRTTRVTMHVVSSLDGYIAKKDNDVSWLNVETIFERGTAFSDEQIAEFLASIDCYVLGSHTYEHALKLGWPYGDTPVIVLTSRELPSERPGVEFHSGDLNILLKEKLAPRFQNIWLAGGADLCRRFLEQNLVDEIRLTIAPVLLGDGLRLFDGPLSETRWNLKDVVAYRNGFVELSYAASS